MQENKLISALEQQHKADKAKALQQQEQLIKGQLAAEAALAMYVNHIRENILNLRCPRCQAVFNDFSGNFIVFVCAGLF